jgi:hypothetical protein
MPNLTFTDVELDTSPGYYYVSVIDGPRRGILAGPYDNHQAALDMVERVKQVANGIDPMAAFYSFGTCRFPVECDNLPAGKLNDLL